MHTPVCPRCGYEQTGLLASYTEACPVEALCSECGCGFHWTEIASPVLGPWWFAERRGRRVPLRAILTALAATRPRKFWSDVRMEHPIRFRGILLVLTTAIALLALYSVVLHAVVLLIVQAATQNFDLSTWTRYYPMNAAFPLVDWEINTYGYGASRYSMDWRNYPLVPSLIVPAVSVLAVPIMYFVPTVTRERHGVRMAHIVRISLYGTIGLSALLIASLSTRTGIFALQEWSYANFRSFRVYGGIWVDDLGRLWPRVLTALVFLVTSVWQVVWWTVATKRYLRFDRPGSFAWPLVGVSLLAGFVAMIVLVGFFPGVGSYIPRIVLW